MARRLLPFAVSVFALLALSLAIAASAFGYDGAAAAVYADTYWQNYNSAWPSFANSGGDCANFVSQALYAGGITMRTPPAYSGDAAWYMRRSNHRWTYSLPWINVQHQSVFALQYLAGVTQVASYYAVAPGQTVAAHASQGDVVLYDWNNDNTYDHEAIVVASDGANPDGTANWDLVDAHTNNRHHAYWTLAQYNANWATTRIVVLHISPTTN
jgi:hypothetical protein